METINNKCRCPRHNNLYDHLIWFIKLPENIRCNTKTPLCEKCLNTCIYPIPLSEFYDYK